MKSKKRIKRIAELLMNCESKLSAIVIDTETTGLNPNVDELLQVSIIDIKGNTLYNQYFKPVKVTSWENAEQINHITPEMVKDCPTIDEEMPKINSIVSEAAIIIGYNTKFDLEFLKANGARFDAKQVDVMREFAPIYGEYKWQKLTTCADYYHYDWESDTAHNSLADCRATLFCYKKIQEAQIEKMINDENENINRKRSKQNSIRNYIKYFSYIVMLLSVVVFIVSCQSTSLFNLDPTMMTSVFMIVLSGITLIALYLFE